MAEEFDADALLMVLDATEYTGAPPHLVEQLRNLVRGANLASADLPIFNRDEVCLEFPEVSAAIRGWIADPAPKLGRMTIWAMQDDGWPQLGRRARIRVNLYGGPGSTAIWSGEGTFGLSLEGRAMNEAVHRILAGLHGRAVDHLRYARR